MSIALEKDDIQGLVFRGYGTLRAARYVLFQIGDSASARAWLNEIARDLATGEDRPGDTAINVAFTNTGLQKLGLPSETLAMFSLEFVEGMATPHRSRLFGDEGNSAPKFWEWGGPGSPDTDLLLLIFARDEDRLRVETTQSNDRARQHGLRDVTTLDTFDLGIAGGTES